jgi:hypothetical protein
MNTDLLGPLFRVRLLDWLSVIRNTLDSCKPDDPRGWKFSSFMSGRQSSLCSGSVLAAILYQASHEIIAMAKFNGADNLCAGFTSASPRRLIFTLSPLIATLWLLVISLGKMHANV